MRHFWRPHAPALAAAGTFLTSFFLGASLGAVWSIALVSLAVGGLVGACLWRPLGVARASVAAGLIGAICALVSLLVLRLDLGSASPGAVPDSIRELVGELRSDPALNADGAYTATIKIDQIKTSQGILVGANQVLVARFASPTEARQLLSGDRFWAEVRVGGQALFRSVQRLRPTGLEAAFEPLRGWRLEVRLGVETALGALRPEVAGLVAALVFGRQDQLDPGMAASFYRSGCAHIVALSGMHLAILAAIIMRLLEPLVGRRWAYWPVLAACGGFVWLIGPLPSLVRAVVMFAIYGGLRLRIAKPSLAAVLAWTIPCAGLISPGALATPGFLLSCSSLSGILVFGAWLKAALARWVWPWLAEQLSAGLTAFVPTAPVLLALGLPLQPQGIVASLILAPLSLIYLAVGVAYLVLAPLFPGLQSLGAAILEFLYAAIRLSAWPFVA